MPETFDVTVMCEIADGAEVSPQARIGPFCVIGPHVVIGPGTVLGRRVAVLGRTSIGRDNRIQDGCVLGAVPQDLKYHGRPTWLSLGDRNWLAPNVTAHVGTENGGYLTRIGSDNVLGCGAHVAHDCYLDDRVRLDTGVQLAGHIRIHTGAVVGEYTGVHHFTTIGQYSRVGPRIPVRRDVPPFAVLEQLPGGNPAVCGVHEAGLAASGLDEAQQDLIRRAVEHLFRDGQAMSVKIAQMLRRDDLSPPVRQLCQFCLNSLSSRSGRFREQLRGQLPPEARRYLPPEVIAGIEGARPA